MDREESLQIEIIRVLCITAMMWVHVNPGLSSPSYVTGGPAHLVGLICGDNLGRISVTTLSFISGYLFWLTSETKPFRAVMRRLVFSIYLPMLVWSGIFLVLLWIKTVVLEQSSGSLLGIGAGAMDWVNALTGLTGKTANDSLFFIRDLVVSSVILRVLAPVLRRAAPIGLVLAAGLALGPDTAPVIFRPSILCFMLIGASAARYGLSIRAMSRPARSFVVGAAAGGIALLIHQTATGQSETALALRDTFHRAALGFLVLGLSSMALGHPWSRRLGDYGRDAFLAYLSHVVVIGILWMIWSGVIGGAEAPSYVLFFLAAPFASFALSVLFGRWLDHAPPRVQEILRGKTYRPGQGRIARVKPA